MGEGTLARSSVLGSAPRVMVEHVREAEWTPDGSDLAVVRRVEGLERLELPLGKVLYQTSGYISDIRFSPSGDRIAFADHPVYADDAGAVAVVDREGHRTVLSEGWTSIHGIAWTRDGGAIWFGASQARRHAHERGYLRGDARRQTASADRRPYALQGARHRVGRPCAAQPGPRGARPSKR